MKREIIGYQIQTCDKRTRLYSPIRIGMSKMVIFKTHEEAEIYTQYNLTNPFSKIIDVRSGDMKDYIYFDEYLNENNDLWVDIIIQRLTKNSHIRVRHLNRSEGSIVFKGIVRESFLQRIKTIINATDAYVTYCRTQQVDGIIVGFKFK